MPIIARPPLEERLADLERRVTELEQQLYPGENTEEA